MSKNINQISESEKRKMMMEELLEEQRDRSGQYRMISPRPSLIKVEDRRNKTCARCQTNLSVKYQTVLHGREVTLCNKCITKI